MVRAFGLDERVSDLGFRGLGLSGLISNPKL